MDICLKINTILAVCGLIALLVWFDKLDRKEEAKQLREQRRKEYDEDCFRAGANIRLERWVYKLEKWKKSKGIKAALFAGAKRIDEMRAQ